MNLNEMQSDREFCRSRWTSVAKRLMLAKKITDPEDFYQEILLPSGLFEQAYELFPRYNGPQSIDASDWIMTSLEDGLDLENDPNWAAMRDEVYDKVVAGLT
jgi:hypothetical protein